jgi:alkanesulfonate monooxygenase SsuD/methylene tetrahydromethanopterin reductase-like flavin-dependent oxidoreductase (luciferase family)
MQFGIGRATTFDELVDDARWAEEHGFMMLTIGDHFLRAGAEDPERAKFLPASDAFVQLAGVARETESIGLAVTVASVTFRHPGVLLKAAMELDVLSRGRFTLGVGSGYRVSEHEIFGIRFPPRAERFELLEDTLGYLRAGLSVPNPGFEGKHHRLQAHPIFPPPTDRVRLLVGGSGAHRTPALAGRFADEFNLFPMEKPELELRIARARDACAAAGRDPDRLTLSSGGPLIAGENRADVRDALEETARIWRVDPDDLERDHRENKRLVGTYDELAERFQDLADAGISRFYVGFEGVGAMNRERLLAAVAAVAPSG